MSNSDNHVTLAIAADLARLRLNTDRPFHSCAEDNARMLELSRARGEERRVRRAADRTDLPADVSEVLREAHARCAAQLGRLEAAATDLIERHAERLGIRRQLSAVTRAS